MSEVTQSVKSFSLAPQDLAQAIQFAEMMAKSSIIPKDFANNPGNILVAVQWGMELGLQPMQAMQNIAVINGRPSLWGDAVIGLVRSSPLCEYVTEENLEDKSICRVKRRGEDEQVRIFTIDDAKKAGLLGKQGPWTQYPKRMMQMRARSWALRDVFPDVLRGMPIAEEIMDIEPSNTYQKKSVTNNTTSSDAPPAKLKIRENGLKAAIESIKKGDFTREQLVSEYELTQDQLAFVDDELRTVGEAQ
jgi:hypothetical protein